MDMAERSKIWAAIQEGRPAVNWDGCPSKKNSNRVISRSNRTLTLVNHAIYERPSYMYIIAPNNSLGSIKIHVEHFESHFLIDKKKRGKNAFT